MRRLDSDGTLHEVGAIYRADVAGYVERIRLYNKAVLTGMKMTASKQFADQIAWALATEENPLVWEAYEQLWDEWLEDIHYIGRGGGPVWAH